MTEVSSGLLREQKAAALSNAERWAQSFLNSLITAHGAGLLGLIATAFSDKGDKINHNVIYTLAAIFSVGLLLCGTLMRLKERRYLAEAEIAAERLVLLLDDAQIRSQAESRPPGALEKSIGRNETRVTLLKKITYLTVLFSSLLLGLACLIVVIQLIQIY